MGHHIYSINVMIVTQIAVIHITQSFVVHVMPVGS